MSTALDTLEDLRREGLRRDRHEALLLRERRQTMRLIRLHERVSAKPRKLHYHQASKDRLFICRHVEQSDELRRLCGKEIAWISADKVEARMRHNPFAEVIDLKRI